MSPNQAIVSRNAGLNNFFTKIIFAYILCIFLGGQAVAGNCTGSYSYTSNGGSSSYNLNSGKSLKIASGTYTGNINNFASTAKICVETGATFTPGGLNNPAGTLINYGIANLQTFSYNTGTVIDNFGTLNFTGGLNMNGTITIKNRTGASMNMANSFQLGNGSSMTNDGVLVTQQDFNTQNGTSLTNNYRMELEGNFNPSGIVNNYGRVYAKKFMNINSGSTVTNYCSLVSYDGFNNNSPNMANFGFIVITTAAGAPGGPWQNNQAFFNSSTGTIAGGNFTNNSSFTGGGALIFSGDTRNQGTFKGSSSTTQINFYDESQTGSQFFDHQNVTPVYTKRSLFSRPTALSSVETCSTSYKSFAPPVRRDYGDAPASYGNASHIVTNALFLGSNMPDAESGSQSTYNAYGDDKTGNADEDGAPSQPVSSYIPLFPVLKMTATSYSMDIKATNANSSPAKLYAWIDLDQSGTFEADEAAVSTVPASTYNENVTLNWNSIPLDIKLGTTFIRLRVTSDSSVTTSTPANDASDGEVEDFPLAVAQDIPPNSPNISIVKNDSTNCAPTVFTDNFNDLTPEIHFGANHPGSQAIRNWTTDGGGSDTYARTVDISSQGLGTAIYFGNGAVRRISPSTGTGFSFDANGKLTSIIDAIEIRDDVDDITNGVISYESDWGPYPVRLSRSFATVAGKKYRLYFDAVPEEANAYNGWQSGIMRVDTPSGSIHFKAPGDLEGIQHYRIEFTATGASSTISFINYGHINSGSEGWCDPSSRYNNAPWCTVGGGPDGKNANELLIDNVVVAATANCQPATISGTVYKDANENTVLDSGEAGIKSITVKLYNNQGTASDTSDDVLLTTATTAADGSYAFTEVDTLFTYRVEVDAADPDLPASLLLGTPNPLSNVTVTAGNTTANQNFGFYTPSNGDLTGKVFEDVNYGGGAGRPFGTTGTTGVNGARVEVYNSSGAFLSSTTTAADGSYKFTGLSNGSYFVRVVNSTVKSTRSGSNGTERGIQTYRTDGKTAVSNEVGGRKPASSDAVANTTSQTLNTATFTLSAGGQTQSIQPVSLTGKANGIDFGFNFSTVVNTNDNGQGSLRQGILNANLLANSGLAQTGRDNTYGVDTSVTKEVLLFNIPTSADPLGRADICGGAACKITVNSQLPDITMPLIVDGSSQPGYVAGTPGAPRIQIVPASGLDARGLTVYFTATDSTVRALSITDFRTRNTNVALDVQAERTIVESCYLGIDPAGAAAPNGSGIQLEWTKSAVIGGSTIAKRNIISGNLHGGIFYDTGSSGGTIQNNFIGTNPAGTSAIGNQGYGIDTEGGADISILDNIIAGNWGNGIEMGFSSGSGGANNITLRNNRIGVGINGEALGNSGPGIMNYGGSSGHQITHNIIGFNLTGGIKMNNTNVTGVAISQNAIYANGNLGIDLGNNGVTVNDPADADSGANNLLNFPILSMASVLNSNMTITGCAPAGATVELFEADVSVGGAASPGDNKQGKNTDYGEGQTYLATFSEGSAADTDSGDCALATDADGNNQTGMKAFRVVISKPATASVGDTITTTATVTGAGTSEFSPTQAIIEPPGISGKVFEDVNYGGGTGRAFGATGTTGINGARVELYNSAGALSGNTTTTADGTYKFEGIVNGNYYVRVVNNTVKSTRSGSSGAELGVQTYRSNGSSPVTNEVGGRKPASVDAAANTTTQTLNTSTFLLSGGGQVQSIQPVTVSGNSANGVNFGFNFSTIVNTNDSGQGSLRQFILNSNLLSQSGISQDLPASIKNSYGSGKEVSIFMIPAPLLSGGVAVVNPQTALPASTRSNIAFDARTQTVNIGDTNSGDTGEDLTAGVQGLAVTAIENPEVALDCSAIPDAVGGSEYCMTVSNTQAYVRGFAFYGANTGTLDEPSAALRITSTATATISHNLFGTMADGTEPVWPKQNRRFGLLVEGTSAVSGNYFGYNGYGVVFSGSNNVNSTFVGNQMDENGPNLEKDALNGLEDGDSIAIWDRAQLIVEGNYIKDSRGKNDSGNGGGNGNVQHGNLIEVTNAGKAHIRNNTLINGFTANIGVYDGSSNVVIEYNILTAARGTGRSPTGSGVLVNPVGANPDPVIISRNSIFANNGLGIDLDPGNQAQTGNRVTKNDGHDSDHGPNELLNFPFVTEAYLQYGKLVLAGCSPANADIELFEADVSPGGTDAPGINKFGNAKDYGEGQIYLTTVQEGSTADLDNATCGHISDADGNNNRGMEAFRFMLPIPAGIVEGDKLTATATLPGVGTSEFCLVSDGVVHVSYDIAGTVFEDVNYGGGSGRAYGAAGTVGRNDVLVELYDANTGILVDSTRTGNDGTHDGSYLFPEIGVGSYYVRIVNSTVTSSRPGGNGSEVAVQTYRSNGVIPTVAEIGGRHPDETDASAQQGSSLLDTTNFRFDRGPLNGEYVQTLQPIELFDADVAGVDFGFNFDTIVNTNDSGQGSLRQFITNANLLGGEAALAQSGLTAGKEYALLQLPTSDPKYNAANNYWSIGLKSSLPGITAPVSLDGSLQPGFASTPVVELAGNSAGNGVNGLTLATGSDGSLIRKLAINQFHGVGVYINGSGGHTLQANHIGVNPAGTNGQGNMAGGVLLDYASNNLIGGVASGDGNSIAHNNGAGVTVHTGSGQNAILGNSIYSNSTGLGIDLNADGVTSNDPHDVDTGPNGLLNYPDVQDNSFGANGTKIVTYDFDLDVASGDYRLEFFVSDNRDPSSFGEGQRFIGYKDISHPGTGNLNFKGTFNANQTIVKGALITTTLTARSGSHFRSTSEFSGIRAGIPTSVCTDLISGTDANMVIDENATVITLLEARDSNGNPITYVISGGADAAYFSISPAPTGATLDCATVKFISSSVVITKALGADAQTRAIVPPGYQANPGNYEAPMDAGRDNTYDLQITATDSNGKKYVRSLNVRVMDVNEAPVITSSADLALVEDGTATVKPLTAQDPDSSTALTYRISGGVDASQFEISSSSGILKFRAIPDYDAPTDTNRDNLYEVEVTTTDAGGLSGSKLFKVTVINNPSDDGVLLSARVLLQGAYDSASKLMAADLNKLGLLPDSQPYSAAPFKYPGTETFGPLVSEATGSNAAVDWVLLELRTSPATLLAQRALILQRDGDLVDPQTGSTTLHFANVKAGNYYVSVRHRNHLGIISANPVTLDNTNRIVNFTSSSVAVRGESSRYVAGSLAMLWAGDINASNTLSANGPENDATSLVSRVITHKDNPHANTNYIMNGYQVTDLNLDGKTLFTGPSNDASLLMGNIILHPLNSGFAANYIVQGGLAN